MAKRLTDTDKWKKSWFRTMDPEYKCFWYFLLDYCDFAGIWEVDFDLAEFYVGKSMDRTKISNFFTKHIDVIDGGKRWFITDFILFQYGEKLKAGHSFHQKIIDRLNKAGLIKKYFTLKGGYYCFDKNPSDTLFDSLSNTLPHTLPYTDKTEHLAILPNNTNDTLTHTLPYTLSSEEKNEENKENHTLPHTLYDRVKEKDKVKDKVKEKEEDKEEGEKLSIRESFEQFWTMYDKKIGRVSCEKLWIHLTPQERIEILEYVPKYVLSKPDKQFRYNPANFLEDQKWTDEIVMPKLNGQKNGHSKKPTPAELSQAARDKFGR